MICFNCGKPGHMQRDCRAPKKNNSRSSSKGKGKGGNKGKNKSVNNMEESNQQNLKPKPDLELAMLDATSQDERPAEGEQSIYLRLDFRKKLAKLLRDGTPAVPKVIS